MATSRCHHHTALPTGLVVLPLLLGAICPLVAGAGIPDVMATDAAADDQQGRRKVAVAAVWNGDGATPAALASSVSGVQSPTGKIKFLQASQCPYLCEMAGSMTGHVAGCRCLFTMFKRKLEQNLKLHLLNDSIEFNAAIEEREESKEIEMALRKALLRRRFRKT